MAVTKVSKKDNCVHIQPHLGKCEVRKRHAKQKQRSSTHWTVQKMCYDAVFQPSFGKET